ncbi:MAG: hypothetical protein MUC84_01490 [Solirubrobacteraceae bacterium]|jgi:hypothetical protein|nr:hypothetical protein [Solirubrobacteraceae bacterium]MCU0312720.1 hypothetical protein [Solirubrobacteraceae bacterium]
MGLALFATFALSFWIVSYSLGLKSFDGFLIALIAIVTAAGVKVAMDKLSAARRDA